MWPYNTGGVHASQRVPPHAYFVVSAVFHYLGPSFAVLLFARVDVLGVAWLRIASAALIFAAWRRPWRAFAPLDRDGRRLLLAWGCVLALMNCCFYLAISRQPLATVAAIEFLPVDRPRGARRAHAAATSPRSRSRCSGSTCVTGVQLALEPLGVAFAFANAVLFALYIVLADRVAKRVARSSGIDGLAASMLIAAVVVTPLAGWAALPALGRPARARGRHRRGGVVVRDPVRDRSARARAPGARDLRAHGLAAAGDRHRHRRGRARRRSRRGWEVAGVGLVVGGVALHRVERARYSCH